MDRLPAHYSSFISDEKDLPGINYAKILQFGEQLMCTAKQATQSSFVSHDDMERLCQVGDLLQKEVQNVRNELIRRKNLELLLPSPNTQKHLPCSNLLSPASPSVSPVVQFNTSTETNSPTSINNTLSQHPEHWGNKKGDPKSHSTAPMYVNLTEQMIIAQSSKRKRQAGVLFCHNCKTKDTPEWRRGPSGAKTLCNACGIRWRLSQGEGKHKKGTIIFETQQDIQRPTQHLSATNTINNGSNSSNNVPTATAVVTGAA